MKRPELGHRQLVMGGAAVAILTILVGNMLTPYMTVLWIGYGLFLLVVPYMIIQGFRQKCYWYAIVILVLTIIIGAWFYMKQSLYPPEALRW